jgi:hypothetical protein
MAGSPFPDGHGVRFTRGAVLPMLRPWPKIRYWRAINWWFEQKRDTTLWFVSRGAPKRRPFFSFSTPWVHGYIGWKVYGLGPKEYAEWLPFDVWTAQDRARMWGSELEATCLTFRLGFGSRM